MITRSWNIKTNVMFWEKSSNNEKGECIVRCHIARKILVKYSENKVWFLITWVTLEFCRWRWVLCCHCHVNGSWILMRSLPKFITTNKTFKMHLHEEKKTIVMVWGKKKSQFGMNIYSSFFFFLGILGAHIANYSIWMANWPKVKVGRTNWLFLFVFNVYIFSFIGVVV